MDLETAVTSILPDGKEAYFFDPVLLWHRNGKCYGVLGSANIALAWQRGTSASERERFYLTNTEGSPIIVKDQPQRPGHAYAILAALDKPKERDGN